MADSTTRPDRRTTTLVEEIGKLEEEYKKQPDKHAVGLAAAYLKDGRAQDAVRILQKANGTDPEAKILLAQARFDLFDNDGAKKTLEVAAKKSNLDASWRAQLLMGELAFEAGKAADAKKHLHRVRQLEPDNRRAAVLLNNLGEDVPVPEAEPEDDAVGFRTHDELAESPKRAAVEVAIGLVVLAGLFVAYMRYAKRAHAVHQLVAQAEPLLDSADVGSLRSAISLYGQALAIQSGNDRAVAGTAYADAMLWATHGVAKAQSDAQTFVDEADSKDIQRADRYAAEALMALAQNQPAKAEQVAAGVIKRGGVSEKVYWTLGMAQRAQGELKLGRDNLRRAEESATQAPHYSLTLGDAYYDDNDRRNADLYWAQALKGNTNYAQAIARDLWVKVRRDVDHKKIEAGISRIEKRPAADLGTHDLAAVQLAQARLDYRMGKNTAALAAVKQALELGGQMPMALALEGDILLSNGKLADGLAAKEAALKSSGNALHYFYDLLTAYALNGQAPKALALAKTKKADLGQDADYHIALGDVYRRSGDYTKATAQYDQALKLEDKDPDALLGHGIVAWKQHKYDDARNWFEKAITEQSTFPGVYVAIGLMWIEQHAATQALPQLEEAERELHSTGANVAQMQRFYNRVIKTLSASRSTRRYVPAWQKRLAVYQNGV